MQVRTHLIITDSTNFILFEIEQISVNPVQLQLSLPRTDTDDSSPVPIKYRMLAGACSVGIAIADRDYNDAALERTSTYESADVRDEFILVDNWAGGAQVTRVCGEGLIWVDPDMIEQYMDTFNIETNTVSTILSLREDGVFRIE